MIRLIDIVVNLLQKHTHFEYGLLLPTLLLWGALLFLTHVFLGILSSLQTIIAEQFSINIITQLANKLTQVKNLNFFENKDHTIKLNTIHNGLHIRPLNYVSNLFFNLQRIIGLVSLFGILFSISIYLPFIMIFATVPCILISNHIAKKHNASIDKLQDQKESMQNYLYSGLDNQIDENFQNCLNDYSNALFGAQYNGVDFSLGQKQRMATIRAFLKPSHCVVLDEPSSAIDPIIEKEFLDFIFKKSQSKMALIITHRMGSVKQADEIIVLDKGKLVEQGNFETLIKKQGLFSELYLKQQY
ncbi:hypothetical protein BTM415_07790 [Helicobacter pylori]